MKVSLIDPSIVSALTRCGAVPISDDSSDDDYLRWIDGFNKHDPSRPAYQKPWAKIGGNGFRGCRRDQFLEEMAKELPADRVHFRRRVETLEEAADGSIKIVFTDGETAEADAGE
jgi:salicylate hydroxylase